MEEERIVFTMAFHSLPHTRAAMAKSLAIPTFRVFPDDPVFPVHTRIISRNVELVRSPREDMSRLHPMSRLGRRKLRRAALIAARVRMTIGGSFENSNLRSRARARTKLVRHTILVR